MADLDRLLSRLGDEGAYPAQAADRLAVALREEPIPAVRARRRGRLAAAACVGLACLAGATAGAVVEGQRGRADAAVLLPADAGLLPTSLLFAGEG